MKKKQIIIAGAVALCLVLGVAWYSASHEDMTGKPYSEIAAYMEANPKVKVRYTVTLEGESPLSVTNEDTALVLTEEAQLSSLVSQNEYLQQLETLDLTALDLTAQTLAEAKAAFPQTQLSYAAVSFLGKTYPADTKTLDLSTVTPEQIDEAMVGLALLPELEAVDLNGGETYSPVALADASRLQSAVPEVPFTYSLSLFGQDLSTDMERVEYFRNYFKDEGLEQFRLLLPLMHELDYLKLDWCGTSDEAMAQLRDDFPDIKVVWRVFFGSYNCLTDTYKIWATFSLTDNDLECLKYCTEVRYLDLGHSPFTSIDFVRYMPELQVCILAETMVQDLTPLRECPKITFLELFGNCRLSDITGVEALTNLEHLNMTRDRHVDDISAIIHLDKLQRMYCGGNISKEQQEEFLALHPDCETQFYYGDSTSSGWRFKGGIKAPRYALLRAQIGYDTWDESRYPKGYLTHEINSVEDAKK